MYNVSYIEQIAQFQQIAYTEQIVNPIFLHNTFIYELGLLCDNCIPRYSNPADRKP